MNFNKDDIEFYLLTKDYASLTNEELSFVNKAVDSEEEYNSLRQLLLVMEEAPAEELLVPKPQIKEDLVAAFEKARFQTGVGATDTAKVVSLKEEKERKKTGFVWLSIAASIAILVGLFMSKDSLFNNESNNQMAQLEQETEKNIETPNLKEEVTEPVNTLSERNDAEAELLEEKTVEDVSSKSVITDKEESSMLIVNTNIVTKDNKETADDLEFVVEADEIAEEAPTTFGDINLENEKTSVDRDLDNESNAIGSTSTIYIEDADETTLSEIVSLDDIVSSNKKMDKLTTISVSLKDDKDMLGMLYTAL